MDAPQTYSRLWFDTFLRDIDPRIAEREVAFVQRQLPHETVHRVLDLCCGPGRHLVPLAAAGYVVTGLDADAGAIADAHAKVAEVESANVIRGDMRALPIVSGTLDAVVCLWQSFGHFDDATNLAVLAEVARVLRPGGRAIFDVYHRLHYERARGERVMEHNGLRIVEQRSIHGDRLRVALRYEIAADRRVVGTDAFEWRLYTPRELTAEGHRVGLLAKLTCSGFDETSLAAADAPRMQVVFGKSG
jgi:SAM-dependent methyltransferase